MAENEHTVSVTPLGSATVEGRKVLAQPSPNFDPQEIKVEFVLLHYTGVSMQHTQRIFMTPKSASAHMVIDRDGQLYEFVACLGGRAYKAWHAGKSKLVLANRTKRESFNACALGIELVNFNGNVFAYTEEQYLALAALLRHLKQQYPALQSADCLLGHEEVAGYRGKIDPGQCFDWPRIEHAVYGASRTRPHRAILSKRRLSVLAGLYADLPMKQLVEGELAAQFSFLSESFACLLQRRLPAAELEQERQRLGERVGAVLSVLSPKGLVAARKILKLCGLEQAGQAEI